MQALEHRHDTPKKKTAEKMGAEGIGPSIKVLIFLSAKAQGLHDKKDNELCDLNEWLKEYARFSKVGNLPEAFKEFSGEYKSLLQNGDIQSSRQGLSDERYPTVKSEELWLSPLNDTFIPFVGREEEIAELNAFAEGDPGNKRAFKLWAMVGPSGAGKTRLLVHWANRDVFNDWEAINVKSSTKIDWANWLPECSTLISIDYIYGYETVISNIIARAESLHFNFPYPVRLLLLDHATPDAMTELLKDPRWGFEGKSGESFAIIEDRVFFKNAPLKLEVPDNDDTLLKTIICAVVYREEKKPFEHIDALDIHSGLEYFSEADEAENKTKGMGATTAFCSACRGCDKNCQGQRGGCGSL